MDVTADYTFVVEGPDGTVLYFAQSQIKNPYDCVLYGTVAPETVTINPGNAVRIHNTTEINDTELGRWDYAATDARGRGQVSVRPSTATTTKAFLGVAMDKAAISLASEQKPLRVAGIGSVMPALCINPPTNNAVGAALMGTTTSGALDAVADATAVLAGSTGGIFGVTVKKAGTATADLTGSLTQIGVLVAPR